ncbi:MAG TPA: hypothetical protein VMF11_11420 [Candidatus Baltobacteraceae bacterium]|nr:hypothetical protein [Candidatus Baltobacteraceae bacterium]
MKRIFAVLVAAVACFPISARAAVISVSPATLTLEIGGKVFGKVSASAASSHVVLASSTCFTTAGSRNDILKATAINRSESGKFTTLTIDVRAQNAGNCVIKFQSESHFATVNVIVKPEEP